MRAIQFDQYGEPAKVLTVQERRKIDGECLQVTDMGSLRVFYHKRFDTGES